jgi:hypothetical protein
MDLTKLSKGDKVKELINAVKSKNSLRNNFYVGSTGFSDQELEDFFDKVYDKIDYLTDSPTFMFIEVVNNNVVQKTVATMTIQHQTFEDLIDHLLNDKEIETSITYFYDIIKVNNGSINFRFANVFDEQRRIRHERDRKIEIVLDIINKPR